MPVPMAKEERDLSFQPVVNPTRFPPLLSSTLEKIETRAASPRIILKQNGGIHSVRAA